MKTLCLATRNRHKAKELIAKLGEGWTVTILADHPDLPEVDETADTFLGNATLKAVEISRHVPGWVLADDSGLAVDALQGAPGVWSARYAGLPSNDANNNRKVMADLARQGALTREQRTARYHCVLVVAEKGTALASFTGSCEGYLLAEPRGENGFGYDPYFVPEGFTQSFGELPDEVKGRISHRVKATDQFVQWGQNQS
jgi:XTP/dITP diphosphohydrolase